MNVIAQIGHNQPPEPTPYELSKEAIQSLFDEAKGWLDGEPIANQEQADDLQKLMRMIQAAAKEADERRVAENAPFDAGKAEVQARYAPLIADTKTTKGMTVLAVEACKKALTPWLKKVEAENRAKAEAARKEAEEKARLAHEAMRQRGGDLEAAQRAEEAVKEARQAEADARRLDNAKASAKGDGRAVTMRDYYTPEIVSEVEFARHIWSVHREDMTGFLNRMAVRLVAAGTIVLPGVKVHHERRPV